MAKYSPTVVSLSTAVREEVRCSLERAALLGGRLLVALSGGVDSVCLLHLLAQLLPAGVGGLEVAHVDHGLREGSALDAAFCRELAARHGFAFHLHSPARGDFRAGESLQAEARRLRRSFFEDVRRDRNLDAVALGHQADDQAETLLLRLVRGTGPRGIGGMENWVFPYVRPLLRVRRSELERLAAAAGWRFREDPTNDSPRYPRNRIRHEVLPLLRQLNPSVEAALERFGALVSRDDAWLSATAGRELGAAACREPEGLRLPVAWLARLPSAVRSRVYLAAWEEVGGIASQLEAHHLERVDELVGRGGAEKQAPAPGPGRFVRFRGDVWVLRPDACVVLERDRMLAGPGTTPLGVFALSAVWGRAPEGTSAVPLPDDEAGWLTVRPWKPGDRLGGKSVKEWLSPERLPSWRRKRTLAVEGRDGLVGLLGPGFAKGGPHAGVGPSNQAIWLEEAGEKRWCP